MELNGDWCRGRGRRTWKVYGKWDEGNDAESWWCTRSQTPVEGHRKREQNTDLNDFYIVIFLYVLNTMNGMFILLGLVWHNISLLFDKLKICLLLPTCPQFLGRPSWAVTLIFSKICKKSWCSIISVILAPSNKPCCYKATGLALNLWSLQTCIRPSDAHHRSHEGNPLSCRVH
jgi:hypothetical protein